MGYPMTETPPLPLTAADLDVIERWNKDRPSAQTATATVEDVLQLVAYIRSVPALIAAAKAEGRRELANELYPLIEDDMDSLIQAIQRTHHGEK